MKTFVFLLCAVALLTRGCAQKPAANPAPSSTPRPAASTSTAPRANEKKAPSANPVPADWIRMYDDSKGYEFQVPQGTQHQSQTVEGVDVYIASVPAPYEIGIIVVAFKDKSLTKEDLLKRTESILSSMGEKDVKI